MICIVTSSADPAGVNFRKVFKERFGGANQEGNFFLVEINERSPFAQKLPEAELYIFASRHAAESGKKALCVHATGNWSQAVVGGNPQELSFTDPSLMKSVFLEMAKEKEKRGLTEYDLTLECTHHGPTDLKKPSFFVEVGSTQTEWNDMRAIESVVDALLRAPRVKWKTAVGFGGGHYPIKLTEIESKTDIALGHICPKYETPDFGMIKQAVQKCGAELLVIEWKGTNQQQHELITEAAEKLGILLLRTEKLV